MEDSGEVGRTENELEQGEIFRLTSSNEWSSSL